MPNTVRVAVQTTGVKQGSSELDNFRDKFKKLQSEGAKGLAIGAGVAASQAAFGLLDTAISSTINILGDAAAAAREDEESQTRLKASLVANVPAWDGNTKAIEATLAARMKLGFSDDEQRKSLALIVGATHDVGKALEVQRTAMDLARIKGIDLATASEALVRVEGGQYRALKALGIVLPANATATQALAAVQKVAAGQAEAYANTNSGKLLASQVKVGESMEKLGYVIMPALADATVAVADGAAFIADNLAGVAEAAGPVIDTLKQLVGIGGQVVGTFDDLAKHIPGVSGGLDLFGKALTLPLQPAFFLKDRIDDLKDGIDGVNKSAYQVSPATQALSDHYVDMAKTVEGKAADLRESNKIAGASFVKMADKAGSASDDVVQSFEDMQKAAGKWRHDLLSDAQKVDDDYYTVIIDQDQLAATNAEISAQRRIIASAKSTKAEIADAKVRLHELEKTAAGLESELASHGKTQSTEFKKHMADLYARLKKSHGDERTAILAEIRSLDLLTLKAKIAAGAQLTLNEQIAVTLAKGGYVSAAGAAAGKKGKAAGGPVMGGEAYVVGERGPEVFVPGTSGNIIPNGGGMGGTSILVTIPTTIIGMPTPGQIQAWARDAAPALARELQRQRLLG